MYKVEDRIQRTSFSLLNPLSGNFYYNAFRASLDTHTGSVLISKPGYDYTVSHPGEAPDECTIIIFKKAFYEDIAEQLQLKTHWFFTNKDIQSLLLKTSPQLEQLHYSLLQAARDRSPDKLEMDICNEISKKCFPVSLIMKCPGAPGKIKETSPGND
ncbi:MAG: hypothetical protein IPP96_15930 [Chitinophagaceae bacterium]|nr:hypothetical protein [Chitinophagaceae bacterium]